MRGALVEHDCDEDAPLIIFYTSPCMCFWWRVSNEVSYKKASFAITPLEKASSTRRCY